MTKLYIYKEVFDITTNWHNGGGLVIITDKTPLSAWKRYIENLLIDADVYDEKETKLLLKTKLGKPDLVLGIADTPEDVIVFPDAGCC